ncbi:MAG: glycoside hydrolase family 31 protein [Bacteroidales bacterium]|nr:glycoside hydrolase family 31 protein [Bacteroidales bacterium]
MKRTLVLGLGILLALQGCRSDYKVKGNSVTVELKNIEAGGPSQVRLQVMGPKLIRVSATPDAAFNDRKSLVVLPGKGKTPFAVTAEGGLVKVATSAVTATVDRTTGKLSFVDASGKTLLASGEGGRMAFTPIEVEGKKAFSTQVVFDSPADEAFYGLGQQQTGEFDHKGLNEELYQYNTKISVPFVVSSKGYGLLFDAYSLSRWGNPNPYQHLADVFKVYDKDGKEGALTGTYRTRDGKTLVQREEMLDYENERLIADLPKVDLNGAVVTFEGEIEAPVAGDYYFTQYYAGFQGTKIGGEEVMTRRWRPAWNPNSYRYSVHFEAGERKPVQVTWEPDGGVSYFSLKVAVPQSAEDQARLSFWSEFEPELDFYFMAGDDYDEVISGYRTLTGKASLYPKWSFGFWQSRERYTTQEELVSTLAEFRKREIPVDNIVQDWMYWQEDQWGSHEFDATRYPDPEKMLDDVHAMHGRFMISVWPKFYTNTDHYKELKAAGYAYTHAEDTAIVDWLNHKQSFYDAYAEGGRRMFWRQIDETLYSRYGRKIDAWWMDASEPNLRDCLPMDYLKWLLTPTALGPSTEYLNAYSLVNADAIYNGQRSVNPDTRVFLLTRNGFAGLQRYSTASWSGDIGTSWYDMRMQMAAGLNYSMAGLPMWGMDIGGFSVMSKFYNPANRPEWQELQTRWHQFGTFVPLFRTHGQFPRRELWNIAPEGSETYESILWYMKLRYRLMPYIYSLAGAVHFDDYTILRGLPMDFPGDPEVRDLSDQWLFGPALMPCPVYEYKARSRSVWFPEGGWYDFYTGAYEAGGERLMVDAPYSRMPLYVRAGSIVPFGPDMQWSDEKPADDILLAVYAGKDASFNLYEDENVNYNYEKGFFANIPITWDEAARTLTIGERKGSFDGMLQTRTFRIVVVDPAHPWAYDPDAPGVAVSYDGKSVEVKF